MEIAVSAVGEVKVVELRGKHLDASTMEGFKSRVGALLEPGTKLVLDFSRVLFVDSSGCGALLSLLRRSNSAGGVIKICSLSDPVRGLFQLVRMNRLFDIHRTREEAIDAIGKTA